MPLILVTVGQQHLLNKFAFVKAYFLINVAATINCVPEHVMKPVCHGLIDEKNRPNLPNLKGNLLFYFFFLLISLSIPFPHLFPTLPPIIHTNILVDILSWFSQSSLTDTHNVLMSRYLPIHIHQYICIFVHFFTFYTVDP